jgi:galactose mutarotase-like enzyme
LKTEISSGQIVFAAETAGAEPWVLRFSGEDTNYIWRPRDNPEKSGGTPLCFPLLGAVPGGKYFLDGKEYEMEMHGFAQNCDFAVVEKSENAVLLEIRDTDETFSRFPYAFSFRVLYRVEGRTLKTEYRVTNRGRDEMFFSVGGHPRFSCPVETETGAGLSPGFSDYVIEFDRPHPYRSVVKSYGPLETIARFMSRDERVLRLDYALFEKGAFCYPRAEARTVTLKSAKSSRSVSMKIEGNAFFQLWTAPGSPFIAMEPWYGSISSLPPKPEVDGDWKARPGTLRLAAGEEFISGYFITITGKGDGYDDHD